MNILKRQNKSLLLKKNILRTREVPIQKGLHWIPARSLLRKAASELLNCDGTLIEMVAFWSHHKGPGTMCNGYPYSVLLEFKSSKAN